MYEPIASFAEESREFGRLFRFTVTACRSPHADAIQLSRIHFRRPDGETLSMKGAMVKGPSVSYPTQAQAPANSIDLCIPQTGSDCNDGPFILTFPTPKDVDAFRFVTASDAPERDPVSWTLEGSPDGVSWTCLHQQDGQYNTPIERLMVTQWFTFEPNQSMGLVLTVSDFLSSSDKPAEQAQSGSPVTATASSASDWLRSLPIIDVIAEKIFGANATENAQMQTIRYLGNQSDKSGFLKLLSDGQVLEGLAQALYEGSQRFQPVMEPARADIMKDMVRLVKSEVPQFLGQWGDEQGLLLSTGVITRPLAEIVEDKLGRISRRAPEGLNEDDELEQAVVDALDVKRWLWGARAIESPFHVFQLMNQLGGMLTGKKFWVLDEYDALVNALEGSGGFGPLFTLQLQCLGKVCEVVELHAQLPCAWCNIELDERERMASGCEKVFRKAEALERGAPEFYSNLMTQCKQSVGIELPDFLSALRTHFEAGQVLLPLSMLIPQDEEFQAALQHFPETHREACIRLLTTRFVWSDLEKDNILRWLIEKVVSALTGGRPGFVGCLRRLGSDAAVKSALPKQLIHKEVCIGPQIVNAQKISAADCREAGFGPLEAKAVGFSGKQLRTVWEPSKLEDDGYTLKQIWDILDLN